MAALPSGTGGAEACGADRAGPESIYAYTSLGARLQRASVDERLAFLARIPNRRPEDATDAELQQLPGLRAALLEAEGLKEPPKSFLACYYTQGALLRFLRAKGTEERALAALRKTLQWARTCLEDMLRQHEREDHPWHKELLRRYKPDGPFGVDKRGAPVFYLRFGLTDFGGLSREVTPECHYRFSVNKINRDSLMFFAANELCDPEHTWLGNVFVLDMAGMTMKRGGESLEFMMWMADNVLTEHFPEVTRVSFIVNAPWFFSMGWTLITPFIPARTREKFRIFSSRCDFMGELSEFVRPEQVPTWLGGCSPDPWEYGEGGDVPEGAGRLETDPVDAHRSRKPSWMNAAKAAALRSAGATSGPDISTPGSTHRPRKPSWMAQAAMAVASRATGRRKPGQSGSPCACPFSRRDEMGQFDPDDRSIGPPNPAPAQSLPRQQRGRSHTARAGTAQEDTTAQQADAARQAFPLELPLLALAAYALHALVRNTGVLGAFTSLVTLLGAIAGGQFAKQARRDVVLQHRLSRELQKLRRLRQNVTGSFVLLQREARSDSLRASAKKVSLSGESDALPPDANQGDGAAAVDSGAGAEGSPQPPKSPRRSGDSLERRVLDVLIDLSDALDGMLFSWPSCVVSWAMDRNRCLHTGFKPPEQSWTSDLPYLQPGAEAPVAHSLPREPLEPLAEESE